jgi:hypothetical protein
MKRLLLAILPILSLLACGGSETSSAENEPACPTAPPPTDPDTIVDSCVDTLHSEYACTMAKLPTVYTAIGCKGTPKLMHPEDGTLIVRADGREGCSEIVNWAGEALTCCPVCAPGRVVCTDGSGKCCDK